MIIVLIFNWLVIFIIFIIWLKGVFIFVMMVMAVLLWLLEVWIFMCKVCFRLWVVVLLLLMVVCLFFFSVIIIEVEVIVLEFDFGSLKGWMCISVEVSMKKISNRNMMFVSDDILNFVFILFCFFSFMVF